MTSVYNFKAITVVPTYKDFMDIVLSKTQRKTPTVVHKGYHISRIRQFYMRKVKFTQKTINEKLTYILQEFPRMDDIHPFYGDLMHVLYDRDHYKVALGQVGAVRHMVDNIGRDYVRLLKYGDSLYRCKQLKRAALGRMATACKKLNSALAYLEKVRQHMSRLPSIDPNARTLLVTGFPNVGKSSFMNKVTRADVEVQPYAFTTKSLFVGHTDYKYTTWQVIDTPGILDHSLEERNVIEMQAITALAHLRACILFFMDLSGQCGYSVEQQVSLFKSVGPLFTGKPVVVVFNKCDVCTIDDVSPAEQELIMDAIQEADAKWITTSTLTDVGVGDLKTVACDMLLAHRSEQKEGSGRYQAIQNRLYCATPKQRDELERPAFVPASVLQERATGEPPRQRRKTERDYEWENGGPGQYQRNERKTWDLENPEWVDDIIPDIMDGHNIYDNIDPDIHQRLLELEAEEEARLEDLELEASRKHEQYTLDSDTLEAVKFIKDKIKVLKMERAMKNPAIRRTHSQAMAIDKFNKRTGSQDARAKSIADGSGEVPTRKRGRSMSVAQEALIRDRSSSAHVSTKTTRSISGTCASRERSMSVNRGDGYRDVNEKLRAVKLSKVKARPLARQARKGEGDHHIPNLRPMHLFTGKVKSNGARDRR
ncbi:NOG1 / nucleolar GTP-binding protein [Leishmania donovani]|uniref:Nucleolar GTP-binding protein 1 n=1 Tax=Leishmania donovani TaxID=5661 RepID=A0A3S7X6S7_LEIDO|nr:nucleolar GTP-binding protein, putative [Leishmania donovani]AYU82176.1 nucleolar GTP-binding protein, putative [Leishmania donovani]TPP53680.1 Nucleolar GTP-binding protein 1 (NOG1) family protein [Leishmania donovani]TPP55501.1 Nucleolar GTP-binding protein 1 (NOG1) family protein [Leishmania donovani]CAJ1992180.1 NOG1 / nucleolar GTP-binding protein [Leishmania donovani]CBZ37340.1 nucleolar GTP-binding protein, putative [Leishmania donovani]